MNNNCNNLCENNKNGELLSVQKTNEEQSFTGAEEKDSFGKFETADALLSAYNNLEVQFTKRCQELKRLEKEYNQLKSEQASLVQNTLNREVASEPVQDETGSAVGEQSRENASEEPLDNDIALAVSRFLSKNPEASKYAEEIALKTSMRGDIDDGFLERAYISVLQDRILAEQSKLNDDFIYSRAKETPAIKEKIIRDYLNGIISSKASVLLAENGQSVIMPPKKPLSISEAGAMAVDVLKKTNGIKLNK